MNIKTAHLFFEQSGTFKNEFIKLGIPAYDYDIQNNFGETDYVIDLFEEIEKAYRGGQSVFDNISSEDLIMAFFPCIYFGEAQAGYYDFSTNNVLKKTMVEKITIAVERLEKRTYFHRMLYLLVLCAEKFNLKLIIENPYTKPHYLIDTRNFPKPSVIDKNRMERGDYFRKPTAYWFWNCEPTNGFSFQNDKKQKTMINSRQSSVPGLCSEERSMISPDYARNFICDFILGKPQKMLQKTIFEETGGL